MNNWTKALLAGLSIAAIVFFLFDNVYDRIFKTSSLYQMSFDVEGFTTDKSGKITTAEIPGEIPARIKKRIDELGYKSVIRVTGKSKLQIDVEDIKDTAGVRSALVYSSRIEFRKLYSLEDLPSFYDVAQQVVSRLTYSEEIDANGIYSLISPLADNDNVFGPKFPAAIGAISKKDTATLNVVLRQRQLLAAMPEDLQFRYGLLTDESKLQNTPDDLWLYAIKGQDAPLINSDIADMLILFERLIFRLSDAGAAKWAELAKSNPGYLAIVIDDVVIMAPMIYGQPKGRRIAFSLYNISERHVDLLQKLKTGLLPANLRITHEEISGGQGGKKDLKIYVTVLAFLLTGGIAFLSFKALKNN